MATSDNGTTTYTTVDEVFEAAEAKAHKGFMATIEQEIQNLLQSIANTKEALFNYEEQLRALREKAERKLSFLNGGDAPKKKKKD